MNTGHQWSVAPGAARPTTARNLIGLQNPAAREHAACASKHRTAEEFNTTVDIDIMGSASLVQCNAALGYNHAS